MGIFWSQPKQEKPVLDGLGFETVAASPDFNVSLAREKLDQLLRGSLLSFRLSSIAQPLVAAFYLGASPQQLSEFYELWVPQMCDTWPEDNPVEESIGKFNLEQWFGQREYEERYYDYFRDCLTEERDWPPVVQDHLGQVGLRLAHNHFRPLLELAAALESNNGMIASEALAMACTDPEDPRTEPIEVSEATFSELVRSVARLALQSGDFQSVNIAQALCELFLSEKQRLIDIDLEIALLKRLKHYILEHAAGEKLPKVDAATALDSKDATLIQYTRARLVLEKVAL